MITGNQINRGLVITLVVMVVVCQRWRKNTKGLETPEEVKALIKRTRLDQDYVQQWIEECCQESNIVDKTGKTHGVRTANSVLYQSYLEWCKENGVSAKQKGQFSRSLKQKGFKPARWKIRLDSNERRSIRGFEGLKVLPDREREFYSA